MLTNRRQFLKQAAIGGAALSGLPLLSPSALNIQPYSNLKITKVRYYSAPDYNKPLFNQARGIVEVHTDGGIVGIGEGVLKIP